MNLLAAISTQTVGILIDVGIVLFLLIFLLVGLKKGMVKMGLRLISSILVIVVAVIAVTPITNLVISETQLDDKLSETLTQKMANNFPEPYAKLYYFDHDDNEATDDILVYDMGDGPLAYDNIFDGTPYAVIKLQKLIRPMIDKQLEKANETYLIDAVSSYVTMMIFTVAIFIILCILLKIVFMIIVHLISKLVRNIYVAHFLDKLVGAAFGLAAGALIIFIAITILQFIQGLSFMNTANQYIMESKLISFIIDNNFLYGLLTDKLNLGKLLQK